MSYSVAEQQILERLGAFCLEIYPSSKVFLLDEDWPRIDGAYFGMQIININRTGESDLAGFTVSDEQKHHVGYSADVEVIAFRGDTNDKPTGMLTKIQQLIEDEELRYKHFDSNNIGVTDFTGISKIDSFLDGAQKELRSRMIITFHVIIEDNSTIVSNKIDTINFTVSVDDSTPDAGTTTYPPA